MTHSHNAPSAHNPRSARRRGFSWLSLGGVLFAASCFHAPPLPIDEGWVMQQVSSRYSEFFPAQKTAGGSAEPGGAWEATGELPSTTETADEAGLGLLRPRFGLPAIARVGSSFSVEILEQRGAPSGSQPSALPTVALARKEVSPAAAAACLRGVEIPGCHLLRVEPAERQPFRGSASASPLRAVYTAYLDSPLLPPPGGYDLLVRGAKSVTSSIGQGPIRAPRAVWLRADDPATLKTVRVAHLSDMHVGKGGQKKAAMILSRLHEVVQDVNHMAPDVVVVTGDIVNSGQQAQLWPIAEKVLGEVAAPVLVVLGNHDIEFMQRGMRPVRRYGAGWANFARTFHPFLHFSLPLGGYEFVGFDSGPAERSARILTRGLHPSSVALLRADIERARQEGSRGVVLFSHAPSRASTFTAVAPRSAGFFGRMRYGNAAFEGLLIDAATRGQKVLHLSGHTHWSDVFELDTKAREFRRWPHASLSPCPQTLKSPVALITTQAAGHAGLFSKVNARGYGFSMLTLGDADPEIKVFRYGTKAAPSRCEDSAHNLARRLADTSRNDKLL
jgi:hypothetical protein